MEQRVVLICITLPLNPCSQALTIYSRVSLVYCTIYALTSFNYRFLQVCKTDTSSDEIVGAGEGYVHKILHCWDLGILVELKVCMAAI